MPGIMHVKTRARVAGRDIRAILNHDPTRGEDQYVMLSLHLQGVIHGKCAVMFQLPTQKPNRRVNKQLFAVIAAQPVAEVRL